MNNDKKNVFLKLRYDRDFAWRFSMLSNYLTILRRLKLLYNEIILSKLADLTIIEKYMHAYIWINTFLLLNVWIQSIFDEKVKLYIGSGYKVEKNQLHWKPHFFSSKISFQVG